MSEHRGLAEVLRDVGAVIDDRLAASAAARAGAGARPGPSDPWLPPALSPREPVVLLAGMLGDSHLWDDVAAGLADVAVPWPVRIDRDDSVAEMALSVLAEAPPRFSLVGHSLGAIVALEVVRRSPDRVRRLALVNASARGPSPIQLAAWTGWQARTEAGQFDAVAAELAEASVGTGRRRAELLERTREMAHAVGPEGFLRQLAAQTTRPDSRSSLPAIEVAVLVVSGELDAVCPPALARELASGCAAADLQSLAGTGHMGPLEEPAGLSSLMRSWLASSASR